MGASTFDAAQLDAIGGISLDEFAAHLLVTMAPGSGVAEATQAPLKGTLLAALPPTSVFAGSST